MKSIRVIALALVVTLSCIVFPHSSMAAGNDGIVIQPMWINADTVYTGLSFSGTTAYCDASVVGFSGTSKIVATITLERKTSGGSYSTVKTWSNQSISGSTLNFSDTYSVAKGYTYRLTINATVTRNGTNETVSGWTEKGY